MAEIPEIVKEVVALPKDNIAIEVIGEQEFKSIKFNFTLEKERDILYLKKIIRKNPEVPDDQEFVAFSNFSTYLSMILLLLARKTSFMICIR